MTEILTTGAAGAVGRALDAEYAAAFGYGVVGAFTGGADRRAATAALSWHQAQQVILAGWLSAAGEVPAGAEPAYALPSPVTTPAGAVVLAALLEDRVAATYADVVAATGGDFRSAAATALGSCAVRAAQWRGTSEPFPGLPERAGG